MLGSANPRHNRLLGALSNREFDRLHPDLELTWLPHGKVLHESGDRLEHVYFPVAGIVSLMYVIDDGESAEVALIGNDGMIGIAIFMGGETMRNRAVVLSSGYAFRLPRRVLEESLARFDGWRQGALNFLLLRYTQALVTQTAQTAVCNRHHSVSQQLCRWLLSSLDRLPSNDLKMTQELIASVLGVRRGGITEAAGKLRAAGLIRYNRGKITVLDRIGLESHACECYEVVRKECNRLLPRWLNEADRMAPRFLQGN